MIMYGKQMKLDNNIRKKYIKNEKLYDINNSCKMATDKITLLRAFNKQFFDFLDEIVHIFPENRELKDARTTFEFIKKANPSAIVKAWQIYVYEKYREVIDQGNLDFFFEKDYGSDLSGLTNGSEILKIIDTLRGPVREMSDTSRGHTMKYIQNLSKLSLLYTK